MKKLQTTFLVLAIVIGAGTLFAQRSTFFDGTYKMEGGRQTMRIESLGGSSYKAYFTGDCMGQTLKGRAEDNDVLMFPLAGGGRGDYIMIVRRGNKLDVNVKGEDIMRRSCGGTSIEGLYVRKGYSNYYYNDNENHGKYDRYHEIQYERNYESHVNVNDLKGWNALSAYDELESRGFREQKHFSSNGKTYRVWYNHRTHQCIKTLSEHKRITQIMRSTHCR